VSQAFRAADFGYVLVTTPAPAAVRETIYFAERLAAQGMQRDALVINRVHRGARAVAELARIEEAIARHELVLGARGAERILHAARDEARQAELDRQHLAQFGAALAFPDGSLRFEIPALAEDVHDLNALEIVAETLCPRDV
jgi:anion-transporting  ArsA/GET3 family ATPase